MTNPITRNIGRVLTQEDFNEMLRLDYREKPDEHMLLLPNHCHERDALRVTYYDGRLHVHCNRCGNEIAVIQVATKGAQRP